MTSSRKRGTCDIYNDRGIAKNIRTEIAKKNLEKMSSEDRSSNSSNSLQNGKSFSISSILAKESEEKETTESKDNDKPAVVSKIGFPSMDPSKLFSMRPEGASSFPASPLSSLPAWYQWYTAGHHFLQQLHQEKLSRKYLVPTQSYRNQCLLIGYLWTFYYVQFSPYTDKKNMCIIHFIYNTLSLIIWKKTNPLKLLIILKKCSILDKKLLRLKLSLLKKDIFF